MSKVSKLTAAAAAVLGVWVFAIGVVVPDVVPPGASFALYNYVGIGAVIAVTGAIVWWAAERGGPLVAICSFIAAIAGAWLIMLPFYTPAVESGWVPYNDVIIGLFVLFSGLSNTMRALNIGVGRMTSA